MNITRAIDIRLLGKQRTGDEAVFFNITKEILKADHEHTYLLVTDEHDPQKIAVVRERLECGDQKNVRIVSLFGKNRFIWNLVTVPWFLLAHHIDTYHTQYILPWWIPRRTKVLLHIHDISFRIFPHLISWKDRVLLRLLIPHALKRAAVILVPSQFTRDEIMREYGVPPEKLAVIPNALSERFLSAKEGDTETIQKKYALPERYMLYIGTLQPRKNIPFLIRAFAQVRKRLPDMNLVLVGNRHGHHVDQASLEAALVETGTRDAVFFPGYIEEQDLAAVLRGATIFVFPSQYEGFGIPLLEAFSQDIPVAAADILALREIGGEAALYFDPTSIADCQEKLYTLCTDTDQRMRGVSLGKSRFSFFSWKQSALLLLAAYKTLD